MNSEELLPYVLDVLWLFQMLVTVSIRTKTILNMSTILSILQYILVKITNCGAYEIGECHSFRVWISYKEESHLFY